MSNAPDPTGMIPVARSLRCADCKGANISIAVWLDVRDGQVTIGDLIHDINPDEDWSSGGRLSAVQFCKDCDTHKGLIWESELPQDPCPPQR